MKKIINYLYFILYSIMNCSIFSIWLNVSPSADGTHISGNLCQRNTDTVTLRDCATATRFEDPRWNDRRGSWWHGGSPWSRWVAETPLWRFSVTIHGDMSPRLSPLRDKPTRRQRDISIILMDRSVTLARWSVLAITSMLIYKLQQHRLEWQNGVSLKGSH